MAKIHRWEDFERKLGSNTLHTDALDSIGGVYVVEKGSNSNGSWVKYSDGTMECKLNTTKNNIAFNSAYGSLFLGVLTWVFPQPFIEEPHVVCTEFRWGTGISIPLTLETTPTQAGLRGAEQFSRATGTNVKIKATAKGRWK